MSPTKYDVNRVLDDFQQWVYENKYTYRQVRGFTGISESVTCKLLSRYTPLSDKNLYAICKAMGQNPNAYLLNGDTEFDSLSIEQLNDLMSRIRAVRDRKLAERIQELEREKSDMIAMLAEGD